jgi:hypothetical protein
VAQRPLREYDQLCGVGGFGVGGSAEHGGEWTREQEEVAG